MAFTGDREDINSIALTVVSSLLEKYGISPNEIGRLEVGTETLVDKSKSTKTVLMQLFEGSGNTDIEGATVVNACYGGTSALLNAVNWVESSGWDGRYAIVVAADIAVYAEGPARPTGGAGAVAVLIGPDAPLAIDLKGRASHAAHVWDFYKPRHGVEYPEVDGKLSQTCYLRALDDCYMRFSKAWRGAFGNVSPASLADFFIFHSPYNKLVQKAWSRVQLCDAAVDGVSGMPEESAGVVGAALSKLGLLGSGMESAVGALFSAGWESTYADRGLDLALRGAGAGAYASKVAPSGSLSKVIGNTYTASVFCGLVSLMDSEGARLEGKRVVLFSYGSGALATMYGLRGRRSGGGRFSLGAIQQAMNLQRRLADREELPPMEMTQALSARHVLHNRADESVEIVPTYPIDRLFPGTYYLERIAPNGARHYQKCSPNHLRRMGGPMVPGGVANLTDIQPTLVEPVAREPVRDVGILAAEAYFPSTFVSQEDLERENGVSAGKYTKGLGQDAMAFTGDREDINSIALTVVSSLLEKYGISPNEIGRLEVGTETLVDKSKSTKTVLMQLFEGSGNTDIEGATVVNACYGGTSALLNAVNWVESSGWDGRYAIVVAADIAVYAEGPARPTGGAGAVAVLIGPDAPLAIDLKGRASHAAHVWDFYKPRHGVEYPEVDGKLSQTCYLRALDDCYMRFSKAWRGAFGNVSPASLADFFIFHSPYNKLVQKAWSRVQLCDAAVDGVSGMPEESAGVVGAALSKLGLLGSGMESAVGALFSAGWESTYADRGLDLALRGAGAGAYASKVAPSGSLSKVIGNTYTASVFCGLVSLMDSEGARLEGKRVVLFSYGSGALATMYGLRGRRSGGGRFSLGAIQQAMNLQRRLADREELPPMEMTQALSARHVLHNRADESVEIVPTYPIDRLFPGTYYLERIAPNGARHYGRFPKDAHRVRGGSLSPVAVVESASPTSTEAETDGESAEQSAVTRSRNLAAGSTGQMTPVDVVVSGIAAGLPGRGRRVFDPSNMDRLMRGENCIEPLTEETVDECIDKNVVQLKKSPEGGITRLPVKTPGDAIKLAAQLGVVDLTEYGVSKSIAGTMDTAAQVAVAAGLEALRSAGICNGEGGLAGWKLPEHMRDSTGVVYASSFPALDAAIGEVMRLSKSRSLAGASAGDMILELRRRLGHSDDSLSEADEALLRSCKLSLENATNKPASSNEFVFDRKFLFRVLVLGNAQLAQIVGARGPNTQTNAACAGTTQAIAMAQDMICAGRAARVIVISGDNASSDTLMPWLGNGFRALGAACTMGDVASAALPFDRRRCGMLLGAGAIGMVLETEPGARERWAANAALRSSFSGELKNMVRCRLLATQYSNSAFHGAALDRHHIASELDRFLTDIELAHRIPRAEIARYGIYLSHETCTHASPEASCAANEIHALRQAFGEDISSLVIINTKGFTGHPMGVSFEDTVAVEALRTGAAPAMPNWKEQDTHLGQLRLSAGGSLTPKPRYALRFAAGFGSQVAFAMYRFFEG